MINSKEIDRLIRRKVLEEDDIVELMKMTTGDILLLMKQPKNFKQQTLINIYWNPALLYNCKSLSENVIEDLISFVDYRYNIEKSEMESRLSDGYSNDREYEEYIKKLEEHFFPNDSAISKNIKRIVFSKKEKTYKL